MSMKTLHREILIAVACFTTVVLIVGIIGYFAIDHTPETIQGEMDADEYRVSSKIPGRIVSIRVKEGDYVHVGDTLAVLEAPEVDAQQKVAEATAGASSAISDLTDAPTRQETQEAAFQVYKQALAAKDIAGKTYFRMDQLYSEGVVSAQKRDEAKASFETATAAAATAKSQWQLAKNGNREQEKRAAKKQAEAAKQAIGVVSSLMKETVQVATQEGLVTDIYPKVGELVGMGSPIMTIQLIKDMWATFNVREDQLKGKKVGDTFKAFIPAYNKDVEMKIYNIKDEGSYAVWKATKTTGQYDLKTFEVKARPMQKIDGLRPGMSLIVK